MVAYLDNSQSQLSAKDIPREVELQRTVASQTRKCGDALADELFYARDHHVVRPLGTSTLIDCDEPKLARAFLVKERPVELADTVVVKVKVELLKADKADQEGVGIAKTR